MTASSRISASSSRPSWLSLFSRCCWPNARTSPHYDNDKDCSIVESQPGPHPPASLPQNTAPRPYSPPSRGSSLLSTLGSSRHLLNMKRRKTDHVSSKSLISAPSNFQHISSGSFQFPPPEPEVDGLLPLRRAVTEPRRCSFRPLELSIYVDQHHLSPILPHFDLSRPETTPPPAYMPQTVDVHHRHELLHQRSYTCLRPPQNDWQSERVTESEGPSRSNQGRRSRAYTSPEVDNLKERVASAMNEMERLQEQIDNVIERQSVYIPSRPTTSGTLAAAAASATPLSAIPALPPAAPSFAQRLNRDTDSPLASPLDFPSPHAPGGVESSLDGQTAGVPESIPTVSQTVPSPASVLAPPLPLVFRPPLRKKKSFARVSQWLGKGTSEGGTNRGSATSQMSRESVTNLPRPIKSREGFYQCIAAEPSDRTSRDSAASASLWDMEHDEQSATTTAPSAEPAPTKRRGASSSISLSRTDTFGQRNVSSHTGSADVGIAV